MNVDRTVRRNLKHRRGHDQSVCRHDQDFRARGSDAVQYTGFLQSLRLKDIQATGARQQAYRARRGTQATAGRPVGLREDQRNVVAGIEQGRQRARRKFRSTGEY
jgi:hypothetical protein